MEALGDILAPYSEQIGKFAGVVTCLQFLSGIVLMNDIRKKGSSDVFPPDPFLGGVVLSVLSIKFGIIMGDKTMTVVNFIGLFISAVFLLIFYYYASSEFRSKIWTKLGYGTVFTMACLAYTNFEDAEKIQFRFGLLITSILVVLVGSPLLNVGDIIKKKSTEGMPFPIILSGTIVAASWFVYGISIKNSTVLYQNLLLLALSSVQLGLFVIYPSTPVASGKQSKLKDNTDTKKTK